MSFILSRATEEDVDELLQTMHEGFAEYPVHVALGGPKTPESIAYQRQRWLKGMREDKDTFWQKLCDKETGNIVAAAMWHIHITWTGVQAGEIEPLPDLNSYVKWYADGSEEKKCSVAIIEDFSIRRMRYTNGEPHMRKTDQINGKFITDRNSPWSSLYDSRIQTTWVRITTC
jgi:hypothetical protein